jgi:hypothetical protein
VEAQERDAIDIENRELNPRGLLFHHVYQKEEKMKRNMACILMLFSIVLINYSLKAYAEDTKPIYGS